MPLPNTTLHGVTWRYIPSPQCLATAALVESQPDTWDADEDGEWDGEFMKAADRVAAACPTPARGSFPEKSFRSLEATDYSASPARL